MPKGPRTALIAEGSVSQSWVGRLPGLKPHLGPVMGLSLRNASRVVNLIRCGQATDSWEDIQDCDLLLLAVPDHEVPKWVKQIDEGLPQPKKLVIVCCAQHADSRELNPLSERGAATGSLCEMDGFNDRKYLFEGDNIALHRLRRLVEVDGHARIVEISKHMRPVYEAGLTFAAGMTFPMVAAAVDAMKAAGMHPKTAESTVETAVIGAIRAYLRAGRRGWTGPLAKGDREELRRQYQALFDVDGELAEMYLKIAVDYLVETVLRPKHDPD